MQFGAKLGAGTKLRQALALPIYAVAPMPDYLSAALGTPAAWITGDDWTS